VIEVEHVTVYYSGRTSPVLDGISLELKPGELVALLGANGSGKSTLMRLCNALVQPASGRVVVDEMDAADPSTWWAIRSRVGFVQQNPENQIVGTVVEEDVAFGPENLGVPTCELRMRVDQALAQVGLTGFERREPHLLSEGQKQRLAIAGALAMHPTYMLLDEPTAMLDGKSRADVLKVLRTLRHHGVGMLHITHHLEDVLDADRVIVLAEGRIAYNGPLADLAADPQEAARLGVELPPIGCLAAALRSGGVRLPSIFPSVEEVEAALWA